MVPSSFMISTIIAEGSSPARRARSHPASVCPARVSTPPGCAITGKMCPGCRRSSGRAFGFTAVMTVCARSCAEMPVVTPSAASMDNVKLVRCSRCVSLTMSGRRSWRQRSAVSVRQMRPRPKRAMKLTSSARTFCAAMMRSPSFSRSSSSMITTMRPAAMSVRISSMLFSGFIWGPLSRSTYRASRSISRLTRTPAASAPRVVTSSVCGMRFTENFAPSTSFTVRLTPSSVTEPLRAM